MKEISDALEEITDGKQELLPEDIEDIAETLDNIANVGDSSEEVGEIRIQDIITRICYLDNPPIYCPPILVLSINFVKCYS